MNNYKILLPVLGLATAGVLVLNPTPVSAHWFDGNGSTFVSSLAQKLGIGEDKVQSAFNSIRTERKAQMQKTYEERLSQLVGDKKITEDQKNKLIAKHKELFETRQKDMENRLKLRTDLESWAKQNGIDTQYLFGPGNPNGMKGFGRKHW